MNRRVRTGVIHARVLDNRHIYTTHLVVIQEAPKRSHEYASLDTYPDRVAEVVR